MNQSQTANYIIGFLGKKGSGKSHKVKQMMKKIPRYIVIDPMDEYSDCVVVNNYDELYDYLCGYHSSDFRIAFRPPDDFECEKFWELANEIHDYTLIVEEADIYAHSTDIHPELLNRLKHGRHKKNSTIWISRSPFEINRYLTRQTDLIVCYLQTEPRDLKYLEGYKFDKDITKLNYSKYEYAVWLSYPAARKLRKDFDI
ncbi:hypothetical protein ES702_05893 [subsurface metagenome]